MFSLGCDFDPLGQVKRLQSDRLVHQEGLHDHHLLAAWQVEAGHLLEEQKNKFFASKDEIYNKYKLQSSEIVPCKNWKKV